MDEIKQIPLREDIPQADKWALEDLYPTNESWEQDRQAMEVLAQELKAYDGHLGESGQALYDFLYKTEQLNVMAERLGNYCMRRADEDTRNAFYQAMQGKFMGTMVGIGAALSFDTPQIMAIPEEMLETFYGEYPQLERYRRYLTDLRRRKAHTLSAQEEKLLAAAGEMAQTPDTVYGSFADADLTFADAVDAEGNRHPLSQGPSSACRKARTECCGKVPMKISMTGSVPSGIRRPRC